MDSISFAVKSFKRIETFLTLHYKAEGDTFEEKLLFIEEHRDKMPNLIKEAICYIKKERDRLINSNSDDFLIDETNFIRSVNVVDDFINKSIPELNNLVLTKSNFKEKFNIKMFMDLDTNQDFWDTLDILFSSNPNPLRLIKFYENTYNIKYTDDKDSLDNINFLLMNLQMYVIYFHNQTKGKYYTYKTSFMADIKRQPHNVYDTPILDNILSESLNLIYLRFKELQSDLNLSELYTTGSPDKINALKIKDCRYSILNHSEILIVNTSLLFLKRKSFGKFSFYRKKQELVIFS